MDDFQNDLRHAGNELSELEDDLDHMTPIGRDTDTVQSQINEVKDFNGRLYEKQDLVEELAGKAQDLVTKGYMSEKDPRFLQTENLQKQHSKLGRCRQIISYKSHSLF